MQARFPLREGCSTEQKEIVFLPETKYAENTLCFRNFSLKEQSHALSFGRRE